MTDATPTPDAPPPDAPPPEAPPKRQPFNERINEEANNFARFIIDDVPELESVAIVFSYSIQSTDLPYAFVLGQTGPLRNPVEIIHMSQQLWRTLNFQLQNGYQCIKNVDEYMAAQAKELKKLQEEIDAAKRILTSLQSPATGVAPPGTAQPGAEPTG